MQIRIRRTDFDNSKIFMQFLGFPVPSSSHRRDPYGRAPEDLQEETAQACETSRHCCQEEEGAFQREASVAGSTAGTNLFLHSSRSILQTFDFDFEFCMIFFMLGQWCKCTFKK